MNAAEQLRAELGTEPPKVKPKPNGAKRTGDVFALANSVDTRRILDRYGISHDGDRCECPGCGLDDCRLCDSGGAKCLHDRCSHVGPPGFRGFRTNTDVVAERERVAPIEAARTICGWFGIEVPTPTGGGHQLEPSSPATVIGRWRDEGELVRVPTGIEPLDRMCRGGLPVPWRVLFVGAPSAGKTGVAIIIANRLARNACEAGLCVGILAIDEEDDDLTIRLLQIAGFTVEQAERRDPDDIDAMTEAIEGLRVRFYDRRYTIEAAGEDLARWAKSEERRAMLLIDSIQAASSDTAAGAQLSTREHVEANVNAMRAVFAAHRMLVVATSEANRASYRTDDAADTTNDLAAGAESRAIEFGAQTQLMLRTPKGHPDVIHVRVAKNRRAFRGEFWLRLDLEHQSVAECPNPHADPAAAAEQQAARREGNRAAVQRDAEALAALLVRHPDGMGERELRATLKAAGHKWGIERLDAARLALSAGHKGVRLTCARVGRQMVSRLVPDTDTEASA